MLILSFIRPVLNICLKHLSSSIWMFFFLRRREKLRLRIVQLIFFLFATFFLVIYFKPVSNDEDFVLITFELWEAYCGGGTVTMKTSS